MIALKGLSSFWNREYQHLELLLWVIHFQHEAHAYTGMRWNAKGAEATTLQIDQIYKRLQCSAAITLRFFAKKGTALQCEIYEIWHRLHQELVPCANQSWWCERRDWPTREKMNVVLRDHGTTNSNQTSDSKRARHRFRKTTATQIRYRGTASSQHSSQATQWPIHAGPNHKPESHLVSLQLFGIGTLGIASATL